MAWEIVRIRVSACGFVCCGVGGEEGSALGGLGLVDGNRWVLLEDGFWNGGGGGW